MAKITAPFVRSPYNYDVMAASDESGLRCLDPSMANQSAAAECDINNIIESFIRTGELPVANYVADMRASGLAPSDDFTNVIGDYHTALNAIKATDQAFMQLPAKVRSEFNNDPGQLLAFLSDEKNYDEALRLGLVNPREKSLSTGGEARPNAQAQPPVGKDVTSATPPSKKSSSLKNKLSAILNDIPDSEEI